MFDLPVWHVWYVKVQLGCVPFVIHKFTVDSFDNNFSMNIHIYIYFLKLFSGSCLYMDSTVAINRKWGTEGMTCREGLGDQEWNQIHSC